MAINKVLCAPQNRDSNATAPTLATKVLPVKENTDKEKEIRRVPEVVVLSDDDNDEEEEQGEEEDDEEAMIQWALSTLRRTQYLSDSDSEEENKAQPKSSDTQASVSHQGSGEASVNQVDSNKNDTVDTSPAIQEERSVPPLRYSPGSSEESAGNASIAKQTNHLQNNSRAKPFSLPSAVVTSVLHENPTIRKIELSACGSSSGRTKPSVSPLVIFNQQTPYIELEDSTRTESRDQKRNRKPILMYFYTCNICEKVFTCKSTFERHKKRHEKIALEDDFQDDNGEDEDDSSDSDCDSDYNSENEIERARVRYNLRERAPKIPNIVTVDSNEEESPSSDDSTYSFNRRRMERKKRFLKRLGLQYTGKKTRKYNISEESSEDDTNPNRACDIDENIVECVQHSQCYLCQEELTSEFQLRRHLHHCTQAFLENKGSPTEQSSVPELNPVSTQTPSSVLAQHNDISLDLPCDGFSSNASVIPSTKAVDALEDAHTAAVKDIQQSASNNDSSDSGTRSSDKVNHKIVSSGSYPVSIPRNCARTTEQLISYEGGCSTVGTLNSATMHSSISQEISVGNINSSPNEYLKDAGSCDKAICTKSHRSSSSCNNSSVIQHTSRQSSPTNPTVVEPIRSCNNKSVTGISAHDGNDKHSTASNVEQFISNSAAPSDISATQDPSHCDGSSATLGTVPQGISTSASSVNLPVTKGSSICETMSKPTNNSVPNMRNPVSKRHHSDTISDTSGTFPITNSMALGDISSAASRTLQNVASISEEPLPKRHHGDNVLATSSNLQLISSSRMSTTTNNNEHSDTASVKFSTLQIAKSKLGGHMATRTNDATVSAVLGDLQHVSNLRMPSTSHGNLHGGAVYSNSRVLRTAGLKSKEPGARRQCIGVLPSTSGSLQQNTSSDGIPSHIGLPNVVQMMMQSQTRHSVSNSNQPVEDISRNIVHHCNSSSNMLVAETTACTNKISAMTSPVAYAESDIQGAVAKDVPGGDNLSNVPSILQHGDSTSKSVVTDISHCVSITTTTSVSDQGYSNSMDTSSKVAPHGNITFSITSKQVPVNNVTNPGHAISSSGNFHCDDSSAVSRISVPETNTSSSEDVICIEPTALHHNVRESSQSFPLTKDTTPGTSQPLQNTNFRKGHSIAISTSTTLNNSNSDKRLMANVSGTKASSGDGISTVPKKIGSDVSQLRQPVIAAANSLGDSTVYAILPTAPKGSSSVRYSVSFPENETTSAPVTSVLPGQLNDCNRNSELTNSRHASQDITESTSKILHQNDSALKQSVHVHSALTLYSGGQNLIPGTINCGLSNTKQSTNSTPSCAPGLRGRISVKPLSALIAPDSSVWKSLAKEFQDGATSTISRTMSHRVSNVRPLAMKQTSSCPPPWIAAKKAKLGPLNGSVHPTAPSNSIPYTNSSLHGGGGHLLSGQVSCKPVHKAHHISIPWTSNSTSINVPNNIHGINRSVADVNIMQSRSLHSLSNAMFPVSGYAANINMPSRLPVPVPYSTFSGRATNLSGGIPVTNTGDHAGETAARILVASSLPSARTTNLARNSPAGVTGSLSRTSDAISSATGFVSYQGTNINPVTTPSNIPSGQSPSSNVFPFRSIQQFSAYQSTENNVDKVQGRLLRF